MNFIITKLIMKFYSGRIKILQMWKPRRYFVLRRRTAGYEISSRLHNILIKKICIRKCEGVLLTSVF